MKTLKIISPILFTVILVVIDQWSKHFATTNLMGQANIVIIPNILSLTYHRN